MCRMCWQYDVHLSAQFACSIVTIHCNTEVGCAPSEMAGDRAHACLIHAVIGNGCTRTDNLTQIWLNFRF